MAPAVPFTTVFVMESGTPIINLLIERKIIFSSFRDPQESTLINLRLSALSCSAAVASGPLPGAAGVRSFAFRKFLILHDDIRGVDFLPFSVCV